jgi:DNA-binding NtrC family response regulator
VRLTANELKRALNSGMDDYVPKGPTTVPELLVLIPTALSRLARERKLRNLDEHVRRSFKHEIIGRSEKTSRLRERILELGGSEATVLISGESGTGKELVAKRLSALDRRSNLIAVNCGGLHSHLMESELFGHRRGAFTDAKTDRIGAFELAEGGTLFLDEVGELRLQDQVKLLRVLEQREFFALGDSKPRPVRCRVVAATNRDLGHMVSQGMFREDLYHRLAVHMIEVPPLRERLEDIPDLAEHFLIQLSATELRLSQSALRQMSGHTWPGNIRELRNALDRAVMTVRYRKTEIIDYPDLGVIAPKLDGIARGLRISEALPRSFADISEENYRAYLEHAEREYLSTALDLSGNRVGQLQSALGLARSTLFQKINDLGLRKKSGIDLQPHRLIN